MPKVSDAHRDQRRAQILDGARGCFARRGFERTTVRDLEAATGLSSGAIFNYYPTKLDLFIALAAQDAERAAQLWRSGGLAGLVKTLQQEARELAASYLELGRRIWSDEDFRAKWQARGTPLVDAITEAITTGVGDGTVRDDLPVEALVEFATVVLDGLMLRLRIDLVPKQLDTVLSLYEEALRGPATAGQPRS